MCAPKTPQKQLERIKAWSAANRDKVRANQRRYYLKQVGGALKPVLTAEQRFERLYTPEPATGCWLWTASVNRSGYGKTKVGGKHITAHRWSWMLHRGEIPEGLHVLHHCDVPACVNPAHLWLGTALDNDADKRRKGRAPKMAIHRPARLTEGEVQEIRRLRGKETVVGLGKRFGVHHSHISRIQRAKYWAHIPLIEESNHL